MHYRRSISEHTTTTIQPTGTSPVETVQADSDDTATTPPITVDEPGNFQGLVSPRVIQWLVNQVKALNG